MTTMTARTSKHKQHDAATSSKKPAGKEVPDVKKPTKAAPSQATLAAEHLPPMSLVCGVIVFSGALFVLGLRDALATGKNIAGPMDEAMLVSSSGDSPSIITKHGLS
jgi:hypothetical protein